MNQIVSIILPLMLMVFVGIITVRLRLLSTDLVPHISQFLIRVALPCFLIYSLSITPLQEIWHTQYFIGYSIVSVVLFLCTLFWFKNRHFRMSEAAIMGFGASMANTGFIGTAVLGMLMGTNAVPYLAMTLIIESILILGIFLIFAEMQTGSSNIFDIIKKIIRKLLAHPIIQAIVIGIFLSILEIQWNPSVETTLQYFAKTATPLALFVIGASLAHFKIKQMNIDIIVLVSIKMLAMPLLMAAMFYVLPNIHREMYFAAMVLAALPMASATAIYAQQYGCARETAVAVMLSTIVSIFSLSLVIHYWA